MGGLVIIAGLPVVEHAFEQRRRFGRIDRGGVQDPAGIACAGSPRCEIAREHSWLSSGIQAGSGSGGRLARTWLICWSSVANASHFACGCLFARLPASAAVVVVIRPSRVGALFQRPRLHLGIRGRTGATAFGGVVEKSPRIITGAAALRGGDDRWGRKVRARADFGQAVEVRGRDGLRRRGDARLHEVANGGRGAAASEAVEQRSLVFGQEVERGRPGGGIVEERELLGGVVLRPIGGGTGQAGPDSAWRRSSRSSAESIRAWPRRFRLSSASETAYCGGSAYPYETDPGPRLCSTCFRANAATR